FLFSPSLLSSSLPIPTFIQPHNHLSFIMDIIPAYAIAAGGTISLFLPDRFRPWTIRFLHLSFSLLRAYHAFLVDLLGVSLRTIRLVHRSAGIVTCLLCLLHILIAVASKVSFSSGQSPKPAALSLALLLLACSIFRKFSYEIFLRIHQVLSLLLTYAVWRHLASGRRFPRGYIYISAGLHVAMSILQVGSVTSHNGIFRYYYSGATLTHDYSAVKVSIQLQKPLEIDAGKYINL
ncbi:hypothetical protein B0O99DRAFT_615028, partial [Bisporella sp. PMI_857]